MGSLAAERPGAGGAATPERGGRPGEAGRGPGRTDRADPAAARVAVVQAQARGHLRVAAAFVVAAAASAVAPHDTGAWLPVHLAVVGAGLLTVVAVTQLLAATWSASPAPPAGVAVAQRWVLAGGAALVAAGRERSSSTVVVVGVVLVEVAVVLWVGSLLCIRAGGRTPRYRPAIDAYVVAAACGAVGVVLGAVLATGATDAPASVRHAHLALNLLGLVGLTIAATLPWFVATQARMKMAPRATPRAVRAVTALLLAATAVAAVAGLVGADALGRAGLVAYGVVFLAVGAIVPRPGRRQLAWAGPRLVQLGLGVVWWAAGVVALGLTWGDASDERAALLALGVGGAAQIFAASLAYLLPVLRGAGHEVLSAGFARTRSWPGLVAANAAAVALVLGATVPGGVLLAVWVLDVGVRAVRVARLPVRGDAPR